MEIRYTIKDDISGALQAMADEVQRADTMEAVGMALVSLTQRAFTDAAKRPAPWAPRGPDSGNHGLLLDTGTMRRSIRTVTWSANSVTVGSDRIQAGIHQFGGTITGKGGNPLRFKIGGRWITKDSVTIPARPFFPITASGQLTQDGEEAVQNVYLVKLKKYGVTGS